MPVNSWTTAAHFNLMIAMRLGIQTDKPFSVFEVFPPLHAWRRLTPLQVSSRDEERVLDPEERILDLVAYWARLQNEERTKKGSNKADVESYHFVYKVETVCVWRAALTDALTDTRDL
jgi:hypothetical protein